MDVARIKPDKLKVEKAILPATIYKQIPKISPEKEKIRVPRISDKKYMNFRRTQFNKIKLEERQEGVINRIRRGIDSKTARAASSDINLASGDKSEKSTLKRGISSQKTILAPNKFLTPARVRIH